MHISFINLYFDEDDQVLLENESRLMIHPSLNGKFSTESRGETKYHSPLASFSPPSSPVLQPAREFGAREFQEASEGN